MLELTLVGGFLGSGKTTWLQANLENLRPISSLVINDFADVSVDAQTLSAHLTTATTDAPRATVFDLAGGCVCCDLQAELASVLRRHASLSHAGSTLPGRIVLETTGVANPANVYRLLSDDPVLRSNFSVGRGITVVDATAPHMVRHSRLAREQVLAADHVVLSKVDLVDPVDVLKVAGLIRSLNPTARLVGATNGIESPLPDVGPVDSEFVGAGDVTDDVAPTALTVEVSGDISWSEYAMWLGALAQTHPGGLLRSKGWVRTPAGDMVLQSVGGLVTQPTPAGPESSRSLTFVLNGIDPDDLLRSLRRFVPSAFA